MNHTHCWRFSLIILLLCPCCVFAQRDAKIPDPDPELERKTFIVDPRFEVNLYAADPLLAKPIQMNWDAAGRLWIASSEVYPQIKPGQKANDKIIILEDTKGVGVADKTTVFADGLLIPTGLLPGDGGCYVANSTELLHFSDTNGDGKADKKRIVLSGFGTEDTHHMLHTLRWGPDGRMYMMQSIYIHSHIETPHGPRRLNAGGIWRFKPQTMELDVFARGWVNPWGLAFDRYGQAFVTDGAGGEGINYVIPGGYYVTAADAKRIFPGLNPGSPKFCGLEVTSGRHLPDDWQGNLLTNDFRGHRVCRFILKDDGSGFASIEQPELIKSTHPAFRPIDVKMGPDGAIYIADWYNPIIQHGEVDFRDPRRDVTHGRIWRVTAKGRPLVKKPKIAEADLDLYEALKSPEQWTRDQIKWEIRRQYLHGDDKVQSAWKNILELWSDKIMHDSGIEKLSRERKLDFLELAWLNHAVGRRDEFVLQSLQRLNDPDLRCAAIRYFDWHYGTRDWQLGTRDPHPRVRLEALRYLPKVNKPNSVLTALTVLNHPMDRFLDYALWLTVRELEPQWLPAFREGKLKFDDPKHLLFAVQASGSPELIEPLLAYLQQNDLKGETADALWNQVAKLGGPKELQILWEQCLDSKLSDEQRVKRLQALEVAARERKVKPAGDLSPLEKLAQSSNRLAIPAIRLIGLWQQEKLRPLTGKLAIDQSKSSDLRIASLEALTEFISHERESNLIQQIDKETKRLREISDKSKIDIIVSDKLMELELHQKTLEHLQKLFDEQLKSETNRSIRLASIKCQLKISLSSAAKNATSFMMNANDSELSALFPPILQTKNGPKELTESLNNASLPADVAKVAIRIARSTGQVHQPLIDALTKAGKLTSAKWEATPTVMKELLEAIAKDGNAARGELVYRRKELNCLKCHGIGGSGGQIGPDMTSIGASAQPDYLLESLLLPSKAIKENYNTTVVATVDGKVLTGIKQRENKDELVLRDVEGKDITIPAKDIDDRKDGKSLMPEGLVDGLTKQELVDLTRFLTELGKVGNYSVGTARVARTWEVLVPNKASFELAHRESVGGIVAKPAGLLWSSEYTTVAGVLPLDLMTTTYSQKKGEWSGLDTQIGFARTKLECGTAGEVQLVFNDAKGVQLWLDQQPVDVAKEMKFKLTPGSHTLTLAVNKKERSDGVRVELKDIAGSAAQGRWVLGR